ncbi:MAG: hypothetical protein OXH78_02880 [Acidimicrobiaceae bacterium]|nr:hypothetical protein [Acidimicrobiaceae bacterium]
MTATAYETLLCEAGRHSWRWGDWQNSTSDGRWSTANCCGIRMWVLADERQAVEAGRRTLGDVYDTRAQQPRHDGYPALVFPPMP